MCDSGFWMCGSAEVLESCTFSLHDRRAKRGCRKKDGGQKIIEE